MMTGVVWAQCVFADVVLLSTAIIITNFNSPYKQWLAGRVVVLCQGGSHGESAVG